MSRIPWRFEDPITLDIYTLPVNPNTDNGSNAYARSFSYEVVAGSYQTAAGDDTIDTMVFESNVEQKTFSYKGFVYNKEEYDNFNEWASKSYPFEMYDDLNRGWLVYIKSFQYSRVKSNQFPYKHAYEMQGIILQDLGV